MGILYPKALIARRWEGALQARLRRAPIEAFLRARSLEPAPAGVAQDSDNLVRATVSIVEAGLGLYFADRTGELASHQRAVVAHLACLVSRALADLISHPAAWRIAALVSTARLLSPWIGLNGAAQSSTAYIRQFEEELMQAPSLRDGKLCEDVCAAVAQKSAEAMAALSAAIAARLDVSMAVAPVRQTGP